MDRNEGELYRVVVGFDFSEESRLALEGGIGIALSTPNAQLHVITVVDAHHGVGPFRGKRDFTATKTIDAYVRAVVSEAMRFGGATNVPLFTHVRLGSSPANEIVELGIEEDASVIVIGTQGRHGVDRLLHSSIAERVVRDAESPVLVMRPKPAHEEADVYEPDPPCPHCVAHRAETDGQELWCEAHAQPYVGGHDLPHARKRPTTVREWQTFNH